MMADEITLNKEEQQASEAAWAELREKWKQEKAEEKDAKAKYARLAATARERGDEASARIYERQARS